jgi:hypothetical protein
LPKFKQAARARPPIPGQQRSNRHRRNCAGDRPTPPPEQQTGLSQTDSARLSRELPAAVEDTPGGWLPNDQHQRTVVTSIRRKEMGILWTIIIGLSPA